MKIQESFLEIMGTESSESKTFGCVWFFVTPWTVAWQASLSIEVFSRMLEWVAILLSRGIFSTRAQTCVFHIAGRFFTIWATREAPVDTEVNVT